MVESNARVLAGRYEVGELIGRGGMAEVRIGRDNRLSRRVAVKLLRSDLAQDSTFQARFRREAQSAAALNHPAIVSVYDTGEDNRTLADGSEQHVPFIVMEYVEGHTVRELIRDDAALPIDEAVEITEGVLSALEYSHHAGIVHRDIKPANVMITTAGDVKVMDFGIARAVADSAATMTQTQAVVGTAQYLSPEQARGEVVDARSDVYSTGALLFELLTGRPPFVGDSPVAVAYQHVREEPPTPSSIASDVPEELDRIVLKALAKDRTLRYQSAGEFRADLEAAQRGGIVSAPAVGVIASATVAMQATPGSATQVLPTPGAGQASRTATLPPATDDDPDKRGKAWIWILSIVAVLLIGAIAWAMFGRDREQTAQVPDVTSWSVEDATAALTDLGFVVAAATESEASDSIDVGFITRTDPPAGNTAPEGSEITLVLSSGPDAVLVPDVAGLTVDEARRILTAEGFAVPDAPTLEASDTVELERVIRSEPGSGQSLALGAEVALVVSSGPSAIEVPDVVGDTQAQALAALTTAGFTGSPVITMVDSAEQEAGRVVSIEPGVASMAAPEQSFQITVATGNVPVPDLEGMTEQEAKDALSDARFSWGTYTTQTNDWEPGMVMSWNPTGTQPRGSQITLEIAVAMPTQTPPAPTPPPTDDDD